MKEMRSNSIFAFGLSLKRFNSLSIDLLKNLLLTTTTQLIDSAGVVFVSRCNTIEIDGSTSCAGREESRGDIRGEDEEEGAEDEEEDEEEEEGEEKTERGRCSGDGTP